MGHFSLDRKKTGLLVIDMQDKILNGTERLVETVQRAELAICGMQELGMPIIATEQNPSKLGATTHAIRGHFQEPPYEKIDFSCWRDEACKGAIENSGCSQWILVGVEAHICIMQTARDLINVGYQVAVLNDAVTSRSIFDYSTAIAEMRDMGARITSTEIVLFELLGTAEDPSFKTICSWVKGCNTANCCQR